MLEVVHDLKQARSVSWVGFYGLLDYSVSIAAPDSVWLSNSNDGVTFTTAVSNGVLSPWASDRAITLTT